MEIRRPKCMALFVAALLFLPVSGCAKKPAPAAKPAAHRQVLMVLSDNLDSPNQKSTVAQVDLTDRKLVKTLGSSSLGHDSEACVSPDRKRMAFNRWADNRMDCPLWVRDLSTGKETLLTPGAIDGEISRISWIDNDHLLYCFWNHAKGHTDGFDLYCCDVGTGERKSIGGTNTDNWYNAVRYVKSREKILLAKGSAEDYFGTKYYKYRNALYECDADGSNERKLFDSGSGIVGRVVEIPGTRDLAVEIYTVAKDRSETADVYRYEDKTGKLTKLLDHNTVYEKRLLGEFDNICATDSRNLLFSSGNVLFNMDLSTKSVEVLSISGIGGAEYERIENY